MSTPDHLSWLDRKAASRERAGLHRTLTARSERPRLIDFASNDYLKLANDPRVVAGATQAAEHWGTGATGSRLVTGTVDLHAQLEQELAELTGARAALVFSSGYLANLGVLSALGGRDCLIVADAGNHASLIDGCRLSQSRVVTVGHAALDSAELALVERAEARALVVIDAINSVVGDLLALAQWHALARRHGALLVIDDAHGIGVRGGGRGSVFEAGIAGEPDVVTTVTLSKSLGSQGGAVLGDSRVIDHLLNAARSFIFDTGLNPPAVGAALAAVRIIRAEPERAASVLARSVGIAQALGVTPSDSAILAWTVGGAQESLDLADALAHAGLKVGCFRPPSVPLGAAGLRITANLGQSDADVAVLADAIRRLVDA